MKTIQPFIDLGWHTVPLKGKLERLSNGKKTTPRFPDNWNVKYRDSKNTNATELGGVITGQVSGIIAIDCDNTDTFKLFTSLDPSNDFIFKSKGKKDTAGNDLNAGTIIYKYSDDLSESYKLHNHLLSLDFLSNGAFSYLPTEANTTKEPCDISKLTLKEMPSEVKALLISLKPVRITETEQLLSNKTWNSHLGPQVDRLVSTKKVTSELFKVITPKDFRDLPEYMDKSFLHPDDVPEGRGSEYLSKVSAILGADESIDEELYIAAMNVLNDLFSHPMPRSRLMSTIIEPMVEESAQIDGVPIWQYNENWQEDRLTFITKRNDNVEAFFDPDRMNYYLVDVLSERVKEFSEDRDLFSYVDAVAVEPPVKTEAKRALPLVNVVSSPAYPFGFFQGKSEERMFNTFTPSPALTVFKNPEQYSKHYTYPKHTLKYFESLIPDNFMRNYLLRFLRRKLDKFEYSPTILYLIGVSGAGKDTFVNIVERIMGSSTIARPTVREFLEMFNGWMVDKYFCQLDEYGNQLNRMDDRESALGKIKAYTGKDKVQIRQMRTDGFEYRHGITFIMTANSNPLFLDADDRRVALFNCPNVLRNESWVIEAGGMSTVIQEIDKEVNDFAYYLATELDNLTLDEYMTPPDTEDKLLLIASKMSAGPRLSFMLQHHMFNEIEELTTQLGVDNFFVGSGEGKLYEEDLFDLYYEMTDGKGTKRGLTACMKEFDKIPTTRNGSKAYYYVIPGLRHFKPTAMSSIEVEQPMNKADINL